MKRSGRPRVDVGDGTMYVSVALPVKQFDALCQQAQRAQVSLPEVIRQKIRQADAGTRPNKHIEK